MKRPREEIARHRPRLVWHQDHSIAAAQAAGKAPGPRECHVMLNWGEKLIVFAGNDNVTRMSDMYCFDTVLNKWSQIIPKNDAPGQRSALTAALVDDRYIVIFGGWDGSGETGDVHCFDLVTLLWSKPTVKGEQPVPRHFHSSVYMPYHRRILVYGGYDGEGWRGDVFCLDVDSWCWERASLPEGQPAPGQRASGSTVVVQWDKMLLFGGYDGHTFLDDMWILHTTAYAEGVEAGAEGESTRALLGPAQAPGPRLGMLAGSGTSQRRRPLRFAWEQVRKASERPIPGLLPSAEGSREAALGPDHSINSSSLGLGLGRGLHGSGRYGTAAPAHDVGMAGAPGPVLRVSYAQGSCWPQHRSGHAAVVVDNCMLITGGRHKGGRYKDSWVLNLDDLSWHRVLHRGDVWSERKTHSLGVVGTRCWLFGGHVGRCWGGDLFFTELTPVLRALSPRLTTPIPPSSLLCDLACSLGKGAGSLGQALLQPLLQAQGGGPGPGTGIGLITDDRPILPLRSDPSTASAPPTASALYRHSLSAPALPPGGSLWSELVPWARPRTTLLATRQGGQQEGGAGGGWASDSSASSPSSDDSAGSGSEGEGGGGVGNGSSGSEGEGARRRRRRQLRSGAYVRVRQSLSRPVAASLLPNARYLSLSSSTTMGVQGAAGEESDWSGSEREEEEEGQEEQGAAHGQQEEAGGLLPEERALLRAHPGLALGLLTRGSRGRGRGREGLTTITSTTAAGLGEAVEVASAADVSMIAGPTPSASMPAQHGLQAQAHTPGATGGGGGGLNSSRAGESVVSSTWSLDSSSWSHASATTPWSAGGGARAALHRPGSIHRQQQQQRGPAHAPRPSLGPAGAYSLDSYEAIFRERYGGGGGGVGVGAHHFLAGPLSPLNLSAAGCTSAPSPAPAPAVGGGMLPPPVVPPGTAVVGSTVSLGSACAPPPSPSRFQCLAPPFPSALVPGGDGPPGGQHRHGTSGCWAAGKWGGAEACSTTPLPVLLALQGEEQHSSSSEAGLPPTHQAAAAMALPPAEVHGVSFPDVCVLVGSVALTGQTPTPFFLHRGILASRCDYLKAMLLSHHARMGAVLQGQGGQGGGQAALLRAGLVHAGSHLPLLHLPDTEAATFTALVRWLYVEQLPPGEELGDGGLVGPLLAEAQRMGLARLSHLCQRYLEHRLGVDTAPALLELADTHGARYLRRAAVHLMLCRGEEMAGSDGFIGMRAELLREMLQRMRADRVQRAAVRARRKLARRSAAAPAPAAAAPPSLAGPGAPPSVAIDQAHPTTTTTTGAGAAGQGGRGGGGGRGAGAGGAPSLPAQVRAALSARISALMGEGSTPQPGQGLVLAELYSEHQHAAPAALAPAPGRRGGVLPGAEQGEEEEEEGEGEGGEGWAPHATTTTTTSRRRAVLDLEEEEGDGDEGHAGEEGGGVVMGAPVAPPHPPPPAPHPVDTSTASSSLLMHLMSPLDAALTGLQLRSPPPPPAPAPAPSSASAPAGTGRGGSGGSGSGSASGSGGAQRVSGSKRRRGSRGTGHGLPVLVAQPDQPPGPASEGRGEGAEGSSGDDELEEEEGEQEEEGGQGEKAREREREGEEEGGCAPPYALSQLLLAGRSSTGSGSSSSGLAGAAGVGAGVAGGRALGSSGGPPDPSCMVEAQAEGEGEQAQGGGRGLGVGRGGGGEEAQAKRQRT